MILLVKLFLTWSISEVVLLRVGKDLVLEPIGSMNLWVFPESCLNLN